MSKNDQNGVSTRRRLLKSASVATAALAIPVTTATAKESGARKAERKKYEALAKNRDKWSNEKFHSKLRKAGFDVYSSKHKYLVSENGTKVTEIEDNSEDEIGIQHFPEADLEADVSIFEGRWDSYADLRWNIDTGWWENGAEPMDYLTLAWSDNQYLLDGVDSGSSAGAVELRERDANGAVWKWDDTALAQVDEENGWVTAFLQQQDDCHTRHVYGTYEHTWGNVSVQSISIGAGGVSIVYSDEEKRWKVFPEDEFGGSC